MMREKLEKLDNALADAWAEYERAKEEHRRATYNADCARRCREETGREWADRAEALASTVRDAEAALDAAVRSLAWLRAPAPEFTPADIPDDLTTRWLAWHAEGKQRERREGVPAPDAPLTSVESIVLWWETVVKPERSAPAPEGEKERKKRIDVWLQRLMEWESLRVAFAPRVPSSPDESAPEGERIEGLPVDAHTELCMWLDNDGDERSDDAIVKFTTASGQPIAHVTAGWIKHFISATSGVQFGDCPRCGQRWGAHTPDQEEKCASPSSGDEG